MSSTTAFRRACNLLHESLGPSRDAAVRGVDPEAMARTIAFVTSIALRHEESRIRRSDLAPRTLDTHRQLLDRVWRPTLGAMSLLACAFRRS